MGHVRYQVMAKTSRWPTSVAFQTFTRVVTLGCPIATDVNGISYYQHLGLLNALGQRNMWGHWPDR